MADLRRTLLLSNESEIFLIHGSNGFRWDALSAVHRSSKFRAEELFGGRFTEIKRFKDRLSESLDTHLAIISFAHGLVDGDYPISPYEGYCEGERINSVEKAHGLSDAVHFITEAPEMIIVCLPNDILSHLLDAGALPVHKCIFVASVSMHHRLHDSPLVLIRRGARLGRDNAEKIMRFLSEEPMKKSGADAGI